MQRIEKCHREKSIILDLSGLGLSSVPPEIGQLTALIELFLEENQLGTLPPEIGQLTALRKLDLQHNGLILLLPQIGQLTALEELYLTSNVLCALPPEIGQLTELRVLAIGYNRLSDLPPEIGELTALEEFFLFSNRLIDLPREIAQLTALRELVLSYNHLRALPPEISRLRAIRELFLHHNSMLALPPSVLGPELYCSIRWGGKLAPASPASILDYYFSTRGKEGRALREVKVIFVGRGEVGKSSMVDALMGKKFVMNRPRTDGISINNLPVKLRDGDAELTLWDFGGQEIMHGTHQFFMTHRSLYVVMVDGRDDRGKQDAEYWLRMARVFGGDSRMLVVMNRQKHHPFDIDREILAQKYGVDLEHFFRTDCESPRTIVPLKKAILTEAAKMLAAEERFPARCWDVKTRLAAMKENGEDYFSEDCYQGICKDHGVVFEEEQKTLLRRLADLGTVVSFPDEVKMSDLSVLNPEWATDGIYRVVTNEPLREEKHGLLTRRKLREILPKDRWPKPLHVNYVMDLMEKFDLCFPVDGSVGQMLVPELLPDKTPPQGDWEPEKCVVFQYKYPILPHGVLPRFITRTHSLSDGRERWRTGVVIADDGAEARLQADYEAHTITVWLRGRYIDTRRALLKVIRSHFDSIHAYIKALCPEEMVAVPGHPEVMVSYKDAVLDERRGKTDIAVTVKSQRIDLPLSDLLNGVETRKEREQATLLDKYLTPGDRKHITIHMNDDHSINIGGDSYGQVGQTLTNCTNMIQQQAPGDRKDLLAELDLQVRQLISQLPEEKKAEVQVIEEDLEMVIKQATSERPNRRFYEVSSGGLLEAAKYVKDFTGNIAGTLGNLGKLVLGD